MRALSPTPSRIALLVLAAAAASGGCVARYAGDSRPIAPSQVRGDAHWVVAEAPAVRQRNDVDCGAAALAMVVARWRPALDRATIAQSAQVHDGGYRLGDLRDIARGAGLAAFAITGDQQLLRYELERGRPVVIGLHRPHEGKRVRAHYEVVIGLHRDGRVATIDPADASWHVRSWRGLDHEWKSAGRPALVVLGVRERPR